MVVVGNKGVGKTSVIHSLCTLKTELYESTMTEIEMVYVETDLVKVNMEIYDIPFETDTDISLYLKGFDILLFVIDVTNPMSFQDFETLYSKYKIDYLVEENNKPVTKYLVGNKIDKCSKRVYANKTISTYYAELFGMRYVEFSSIHSSVNYLKAIVHQYYNIPSQYVVQNNQ